MDHEAVRPVDRGGVEHPFRGDGRSAAVRRRIGEDVLRRLPGREALEGRADLIGQGAVGIDDHPCPGLQGDDVARRYGNAVDPGDRGGSDVVAQDGNDDGRAVLGCARDVIADGERARRFERLDKGLVSQGQGRHPLRFGSRDIGRYPLPGGLGIVAGLFAKLQFEPAGSLWRMCTRGRFALAEFREHGPVSHLRPPLVMRLEGSMSRR